MMLSDDVRDLTIDPDHRVSFWHSGKLRKVGPRGSRAPVRSELSSGSEDELPHKAHPPTPEYREIIYISSDSDSDSAPASFPPIYHVVNESAAYCKTSIEASPAHATVVEAGEEPRESVIARALARLKDVVPETPPEAIGRLVAERLAQSVVGAAEEEEMDGVEDDVNEAADRVCRIESCLDILDHMKPPFGRHRHCVLTRVRAEEIRQRAKTWRAMTGIPRPNSHWNPIDLSLSD